MIGLFTNPYVAIMLLCIGGFAHQALSGALITLSSDVLVVTKWQRQTV